VFRHRQCSPPRPKLAWNSGLHHVDTGLDHAREPSSRFLICQALGATVLIIAVAEELQKRLSCEPKAALHQIMRQLLLQVMSCMLSSRTSSAASLPAYMHSK
jgi:hypothetical protein